MNLDRDRPDGPGDQTPAPVFRPLRGSPGASHDLPRPFIRPRFRPAGTGTSRSAPAPDERSDPRPTAAGPRFRRFAAALRGPDGPLGPTPRCWGGQHATDQAGDPASSETSAPARPASPDGDLCPPVEPSTVGAPQAGFRFLSLPRRRAVGSLVRRARRGRVAALAAAATAVALGLVVVFDQLASADRGPLRGASVIEGDLVRAPRTAAKYRPVNRTGDATEPGVLPIAAAPLAISDPSPGAGEPVTALRAGRPQSGHVALSATVRGEADPDRRPVPGATLAGTAGPGAVREGPGAPPPMTREEVWETFYDLGYRLQRRGEITAAVAAYRAAAATGSAHAATYYNLGYLLQQEGDQQAAIAMYRRALELQPDHAFAHYNLGYLLQQRHDFRGAIAHYQQAIASRPTHALSYYNLAYLQQQLGDYPHAIANYRKSIELDPDHTLSYRNLAMILDQQRRQ